MIVRALFLILMCLAPAWAVAQNGPLRIEITEGVIEPLPVAIPDLVPEGGAAETGASALHALWPRT